MYILYIHSIYTVCVCVRIVLYINIKGSYFESNGKTDVRVNLPISQKGCRLYPRTDVSIL